MDFSLEDATAIFVYLVPAGMAAVKPALENALARGVRIVTYGNCESIHTYYIILLYNYCILIIIHYTNSIFHSILNTRIITVRSKCIPYIINIINLNLNIQTVVYKKSTKLNLYCHSSIERSRHENASSNSADSEKLENDIS
jgi:hypothetical protein